MSVTYHDKGIRVSLLAPLGVRTPMLGNIESPFETAAGPVKESKEVADMVVSAIDEERLLILTDEIAQTWMTPKADKLERWLRGMRRLQDKIDSMKPKVL